jgi:DNA (cytosine-5)-methyltransferase 1
MRAKASFPAHCAGRRTFLEFFAGGGLSRAGLGPSWRCLFANDVDARKCAAYRANFGDGALVEADIAALTLDDLPRVRADLAWGSFPCQDLSLAGARAGLSGARSGLFYEFARLLGALSAATRAPRTVVIENVTGLLTSNAGADFAAVAAALARLGYRISALVLNADAFVPQSRPRLFVFGFADETAPDFAAAPRCDAAAPPSLRAAVNGLDAAARSRWGWIAARPQARRNAMLADLIDKNAGDWSRERGASLVAQMSAIQRARVEALMRAGERRVGAGFRRIRIEAGRRVQRFEARFDGLAGCLRTPAGGSSRQFLMMAGNGEARARLMSPREAARVLGVADDYVLPVGATDALKLLGDGVSPPVVRWIAEAILEPGLGARRAAA